ncbi:MAG: DUF2384 domain-containing protein [Deltaproteobacteria bacterium]|nr:DUF2384 domain-containing protein [Deltaproteobacteria bacterium]
MNKKAPSLKIVESKQKNLSQAGLNAFFKLAQAWALNLKEQMDLLGLNATSTYYQWKKQAPKELSRDTLERLSHLLGIYKALQILFPDPKVADAWVKKSNQAPLFEGLSALEKMRQSLADLYQVRAYLDAQRGAW